MSEFDISVEGLSQEIVDAYAIAELGRVQNGSSAMEWAFGNNPTPFAIARKNGKIVGVSAYSLSRMKFGDNIGTALQAIDSFVMPEARRQGLFSTLATAYRDHAEGSKMDLIWGFPNANAAPVWFNRMGWRSFGQVPFMIKPLRAGYFLRKIGLNLDFKILRTRDAKAEQVSSLGEWINPLWQQVANGVGVCKQRDVEYLSHRLFHSPDAGSYRVVVSAHESQGAMVASREMDKHGGKIAYLMEAFGENDLRPLLESELGRLADRGAELALAWSYPWSPNYPDLRKAGFVPLPERLRPIEIWAGASPISRVAVPAFTKENWYLSYLDSDTV